MLEYDSGPGAGKKLFPSPLPPDLAVTSPYSLSDKQTVNEVRVNRLCIVRKRRLLFLLSAGACSLVERVRAAGCGLASFLLVGYGRFCSFVFIILDETVRWSSPTFIQDEIQLVLPGFPQLLLLIAVYSFPFWGQRALT